MLTGCNQGDNAPEKPEEPDPNENLTYVNPVFQPVLADPTVVKSGASYYAFGTEDDWGTEGGYHLVPVVKSTDLVNWTFVANAFQTKPEWKGSGGIWAPDVSEVNGKFHMYYSFSTWGDSNPGIGLAIADRPEGPYTDQGKVFDSNQIGVKNSIDPFYIEDGGEKYLFWGSFQGIFAVKLSPDGKTSVGEKTHIAANHLEASYVFKRNNYYYFFGSEGSCCDGAASTYRIRVARSAALLGPYRDKNGNDIALGAYGELLLRGNDGTEGFAGPGHNAEIIVDSDGTHWLLYHAMRKSNAKLSNGTNRRSLMLDKIIWLNDWPEIQGQQPTTIRQYGPVF